MPCTITFCQQAGKNKKRNQDALFNGLQVFQSMLKKPEKLFENGPLFILGIADGVSCSHHSEKASKFVMNELLSLSRLNRQTIFQLQENLSLELAVDYYGSATTFLAVEIDQEKRTAKILSVGDSRVYLITVSGNWIQLTKDHSILNTFLNEEQKLEWIELASIYNGITSFLVADNQPFQEQVFYREINFQQGESLLLCSDGFYQDLSVGIREKIWATYSDGMDRLTCCRKMIKKKPFYDDLSIILCSF